MPVLTPPTAHAGAQVLAPAADKFVVILRPAPPGEM
jgi:hypothetical protein